jgi:phosphoserine phosphatase RsbX
MHLGEHVQRHSPFLPLRVRGGLRSITPLVASPRGRGSFFENRMTTMPQRPQVLDWSVASRALPGQLVSGDLHLVAPWRDGVLVGVVDGLGHGEEATAAARIAIAVLEQHAGESVISLVQHCHRALLRTRGVVMTLASLNTVESTVSVVGIGNVETVIVRANPLAQPRRESVLLRGGVVGYQLPALHASILPIMAGDVLVFCTDGVREDFCDLINPQDPMPQLVERIMAKKFRGTDDGLVLGCRYVGKS